MAWNRELSSKIICFFLALSIWGSGMGCLAHCAILNSFSKSRSSSFSSQSKQTIQTDQLEQASDIEDHSCCVKKGEHKKADKDSGEESFSTDLKQDSCGCTKRASFELFLFPQNQKFLAHIIQPTTLSLFIPADCALYLPDKKPDRLPDQSSIYLQCNVILI